MGIITQAPTFLRDRAWEGQVDRSYKDLNAIAAVQLPFGRFVAVDPTSTDKLNPVVTVLTDTSVVDDIFGVTSFAGHETNLRRGTLTSPGGFPAYAADDACTLQKEAIMYFYATTDFALGDTVHAVIDATNADEVGRISNTLVAGDTIALPQSMARVIHAASAGELVRVSITIN